MTRRQYLIAFLICTVIGMLVLVLSLVGPGNKLTGTFPANNDRISSNQQIYLTFSRPITLQPQDVVLSPEFAHDIGIINNTLIITPLVQLKNDTNYSVVIQSKSVKISRSLTFRTMTFEKDDLENRKPQLSYKSLNPGLDKLPLVASNYSVYFHLYDGQKIKLVIRLAATLNDTDIITKPDLFAAYQQKLKEQKSAALTKLQSLGLKDEKDIEYFPTEAAGL